MLRTIRSIVGETIAITRYATLRSMLRGSCRRQLHSVEIADLIGGESVNQRFQLVDAALDLFSKTTPRWFERFRHEVRWIVFLESGPEFWRKGRVCVLNDISALTTTEVALHLVHEATHARLASCGIRYEEANRARIEAACVRREVDFLMQLPYDSQLLAETERKLDTVWWSDKQIKLRHRETLRAAGAPRWLIRLFNGSNQ